MEHPGTPFEGLALVRSEVVPGQLWCRFEVSLTVFAAVHFLARGKDATCADLGLAVGQAD